MRRLLFALLFSFPTLAVNAQGKATEVFVSVKSSKDLNFERLLRDSASIKKSVGSDQYYSRISRLIFKGDIEPMFAEAKTWKEIEKSLIGKYNAIGEEAYLRTRAGIAMQMKQWAEYLPLAKRLLEKYGSHLSEADRKKHEEAMKANQ